LSSRKIISYVISAFDDTKSGIASAVNRLSGLAAGVFKNLANIKAGFEMAYSAISGAAQKMWGAVKESFRFETLTTQFRTLIGNIDQAREHMAMLKRLGDTPPFGLEEFAAASRELMVMSDGALGLEKSLTLIGDAAAATGKSIDTVAHAIGRAYAVIRDGQPVARATMELRNMGLITPALAAELDEMQKSGEDNIKMWAKLEESLGKYAGAMDRTLETGDGMVGALGTSWTNAVRQFGDAFKDAAKDGIQYLIGWMERLVSDGTVQRWAQQTLDVINAVAAAAKALYDGGDKRSQAWSAIKDVLVGALEVGASKAVKLLMDAAPKIGALMGSAVKSLFTGAGQKNEQKARQELGLEDKYNQAAYGSYGTAIRPGLTAEEKRQVKVRALQIKRQSDLEAAGFSATEDAGKTAGEMRLELGLANLKKIKESFIDEVKQNTDSAARSKVSAPDPTRKMRDDVERQKIVDDMAAAQKLTNENRLAEERKKLLDKEAEDRERASKLLIETEHKARIANAKAEADAAEKSQAAMQARLSRAKAATDQAWGWYRDPDSFSRQLAEEKADAEARKQFEKDSTRLTRQTGWRTRTLGAEQEAVRRVIFAREEEKNAERTLELIAESTAATTKLLEELLAMK
jgi:hypothetical protein